MDRVDAGLRFEPGIPPEISPKTMQYLLRTHRHLPVVLYSSSYVDGRWTIRYVSNAVELILGYKPEELVDRRCWLDVSHGGEAFYEVIPKTSDEPRRFHQTIQLCQSNGELKTFSDDGVFLYDENGDLCGSVGVFVDITTQKQAEEAMALDYQRLRNLIKRPVDLFGIVGNSPVMQELFSRIIKLAAISANVVVTGESGTGKELAARAIHSLSNRSDKPFVAVNCGAISDSLFESEFFGHVKGAFTGAAGDRQGYLELANGGTIFLDEVGEIAPTLQAKLLRALDGYGYLPVGGSVLKTSNFRLIAATNRNLESMIKNLTMRKDFYYRIKAFHLNMPPLRERREDIPLLAHYFLKRIPGANHLVLGLDILERLNNHSWPGNVRELQNAIYRYVTFQELDLEDSHQEVSDSAPVSSQLLEAAPDWEAKSDWETAPPAGVWGKPPVPVTRVRERLDSGSAGPHRNLGGAMPLRVHDDERATRERLLAALDRNLWNVSRTAKQLGWGRATIYRWMNRLGLARPDGEPPQMQ